MIHENLEEIISRQREDMLSRSLDEEFDFDSYNTLPAVRNHLYLYYMVVYVIVYMVVYVIMYMVVFGMVLFNHLAHHSLHM